MQFPLSPLPHCLRSTAVTLCSLAFPMALVSRLLSCGLQSLGGHLPWGACPHRPAEPPPGQCPFTSARPAGEQWESVGEEPDLCHKPRLAALTTLGESFPTEHGVHRPGETGIPTAWWTPGTSVRLASVWAFLPGLWWGPCDLGRRLQLSRLHMFLL